MDLAHLVLAVTLLLSSTARSSGPICREVREKESSHKKHGVEDAEEEKAEAPPIPHSGFHCFRPQLLCETEAHPGRDPRQARGCRKAHKRVLADQIQQS